MRLGVIPALALLAGAGAAGERPWTEVPFLQLFFHRDAAPAVKTSEIRFAANRPGFFAAPSGEPNLPALLLTSESPDSWTRQCATEIAGIGYAVLAVSIKPPGEAPSPLVAAVAGDAGSATLHSALDWLHAHRSVDSGRTGAIAWGSTAPAVLEVAARRHFQAVVILGQDAVSHEEFPVLAIARARPSEPEWVQIYEFLGKHVEDVRPAGAPEPPDEAGIARVVDIMRAINSNDGIRGLLARALSEGPHTDAQWEQARAEAAMLAEAGNLLLARRPAKGSLSGWRQRAADYRGAAQEVLKSVEARDSAAAERSLASLAQTCGNCHSEYR